MSNYGRRAFSFAGPHSSHLEFTTWSATNFSLLSYVQTLAEDIFIWADYAFSALETILNCLMGYISVLSNSNSNAMLMGVLTGVAVVGGLVYAVGGFNGSLRVRTVDVYDPVKDTWSSVASMEARRSTLGAAVLNGCIYAIGGFDGSSGHTSFIYLFIYYRNCMQSTYRVAQKMAQFFGTP